MCEAKTDQDNNLLKVLVELDTKLVVTASESVVSVEELPQVPTKAVVGERETWTASVGNIVVSPFGVETSEPVFGDAAHAEV